jgi:hypothetical protein
MKIEKFFDCSQLKEINDNEFIFCQGIKDEIEPWKFTLKYLKCNKMNNLTEISENEFNSTYYGEKYKEISPQLRVELYHYSFCRSEKGDYYFSFFEDSNVIGFNKFGNKIFELDNEVGSLGDGHSLYAIVYEPPHFLWLAYPSGSKVVKFSLETNQEVFRFGNFEYEPDPDWILSYPEELFIDQNYLYIPNMGNGKLYKVNLKTLEIIKYLEFEGQLWDYCKVCNREFIWLETGVYEVFH